MTFKCCASGRDPTRMPSITSKYRQSCHPIQQRMRPSIQSLSSMGCSNTASMAAINAGGVCCCVGQTFDRTRCALSSSSMTFSVDVWLVPVRHSSRVCSCGAVPHPRWPVWRLGRGRLVMLLRRLATDGKNVGDDRAVRGAFLARACKQRLRVSALSRSSSPAVCVSGERARMKSPAGVLIVAIIRASGQQVRPPTRRLMARMRTEFVYALEWYRISVGGGTCF